MTTCEKSLHHAPLPWTLGEIKMQSRKLLAKSKNRAFIDPLTGAQGIDNSPELIARISAFSKEQQANAMFIEMACNLHEELLKLIKTAYCIVAEAMPEQAPDPSAFVVVQKAWLKRTEQAIAKAEATHA